MKLQSFLAISLLMPLMAGAQITKVESSVNTFVVDGDDMNARDLKTMAANLCDYHGAQSLQTIHEDKFRMHTQAEDNLEEWFVFAEPMGRMVSVKRMTYFNEEGTSSITFTCIGD